MNGKTSNNTMYNEEFLCGRFCLQTKAYYFKEWNDFKMSFHSHNAIEIMYVINGDCLVETKNSLHTMKKGEFILLDANIEHRLQVEKERPCRMLNVEFGFCEDDSCILPFDVIVKRSETLKQLIKSRVPYIVLKDSGEVYVTLKSLVMELDRDSNRQNLLLQLLYAQLLIRISRLYCESIVKNSGTGVMHVKKAVQYIHHNYYRDIQIKDIAGAVNVHPGYLHRIFKSNKGCTINEYLMQIRMEKAKTLLANTDIQISDVPGYVGINSGQYFAYIFKKWTGNSPKSFRKSIMKSDYDY